MSVRTCGWVFSTILGLLAMMIPRHEANGREGYLTQLLRRARPVHCVVSLFPIADLKNPVRLDNEDKNEVHKVG